MAKWRCAQPILVGPSTPASGCSCRRSWRPSSSSPSRRRNTSSSVWHYVGTRYFLKILSKCVISSFKFILSDRPAPNNGASCMYHYAIFLNHVLFVLNARNWRKNPKKNLNSDPYSTVPNLTLSLEGPYVPRKHPRDLNLFFYMLGGRSYYCWA